jgi:hypothetical protein
VTDKSDVLNVLLALYLLTDGDIHDSVLDHQLRVEVNKPQAEIDRAMATLVKQGLAKPVFMSEGVTWLGVTAKGARVFAELSSRVS